MIKESSEKQTIDLRYTFPESSQNVPEESSFRARGIDMKIP